MDQGRAPERATGVIEDNKGRSCCIATFY